MRTIEINEIEEVSGGVSSDAVYGAAVGVATALALGAVAGAAVPIAAGGIIFLAGSSMFASGVAIWTVIHQN